MILLRSAGLWAAAVFCSGTLLPAPLGSPSARQTPAEEETAFLAARAQTQPGPRAAALQQFLVNFPSGARAATARRLLFTTDLDAFPDHPGELDSLASALIQEAGPGPERWLEEAHVADSLAGAGDHGVDLPRATAWARDAVHAISEPSYIHAGAALQRRLHLPRLPAAQTLAQDHAQFAHDRAVALAALAHTELRLGDLSSAAAHLAEAQRLDPQNPEIFSLTGQLALQQNDPPRALLAFIHASALGPLAPHWRAAMQSLYASGRHSDPAALDAEIEDAYRTLHAPVFTLPPRRLPPGGHPVLLELFTGSDCAPCAAPDLAVDSLLGSYTRKDLIALEYDESIPRPDPLANADSVARAAFYAVDATPTALLDGQPVPLLGGTRKDTETVVLGLADQVEPQAGLTSTLRLALSADRGTDGGIAIHTELTIDRSPGSVITSPAAPSTGDTSLRTLQRAVLFVALAEDNLPYMGQNGVLRHRMVVRALRQLPAATLLTRTGQPGFLEFQPSALDAQQAAFLAGFEQHNDRFGSFHFPIRDIPIRTDHLAVVAWVQDPLSRQVLQSATVAVPPSR